MSKTGSKFDYGKLFMLIALLAVCWLIVLGHVFWSAILAWATFVILMLTSKRSGKKYNGSGIESSLMDLNGELKN